MDLFDYIIFSTYLSILLFLGILFRKRSAMNLNSYFLADRKLSWLYLAMSGSVSNFDIAGTMFISSLLFLMGMKSMWVHMMWGVLMGAYFMSFMGRWVRSSQVLTPAEWMLTRFGSGKGGRLAQLMYAVMAIVTLTASIGYAFQGVGKFASIYFPFSSSVCALAIIAFTTIYAMLGGLKAVVFSDVIQTLILSVSAVIVAGIAWYSLSPDILDDAWVSLVPPQTTDIPGYEMFGLLVIVWSIKGLLLNLGGPGQMYDFQRFLAAKNPADAAKTGAAWSLFLVVRWPMCMGIALLALNGVKSGIHDPEQVMPLVIRDYLPSGVRGLVLTGFFAAFMSTFSSVLNCGASFLVKDIWQGYFAPQASQEQLIKASYFAILFLVFAGISCGLLAESISQIWSWIMMALGSGVIIPNVLRWYWWRMNGWGYGCGLIAGMISAFVGLYVPHIEVYESFLMSTISSTLSSVLVSMITPPVSRDTLLTFYKSVRPFGLWKEVRSELNQEDITPPETLGLTALNTSLGMVVIVGLYVGPMYFVAHRYQTALTFLCISGCATIVLYFTWYRKIVRVWELYTDGNKQAAAREFFPGRLSNPTKLF